MKHLNYLKQKMEIREDRMNPNNEFVEEEYSEEDEHSESGLYDNSRKNNNLRAQKTAVGTVDPFDSY